ncbi:MAG: peptidoglycan editing factor PgeF [Rickettsiales bacterium]
MTKMFLQSDLLKLNSIQHGFFTRNGGVSEGFYASLNCGPGSKDNPEHVEKNRTLAAEALGGKKENLCTLYQVHSPDCLIIDNALGDDRPKADAMATNVPGLILGILTADCAPVLFCDPEAKVIGAAHAGWRGAFGGVIQNTVQKMASLGAIPERILAAVGPCAGWQSYEVDPAFRDTFLAQSAENQEFFKDGAPEKFLFNLKGYVANHLAKAGILTINILANDTIAEVEQFFSFRRTTHAKEPDYGRELSAIMIR